MDPIHLPCCYEQPREQAPTPGLTTTGWGGLRFWWTDSTAQDSSRLLYCRLEYGKGAGSSPDTYGGAVYCDSSSALRVGHCRFVRDSANYGGAMSLWYGSSPMIHDCAFQENVAAYVGGAIHAHYSSSPTVNRCTFDDNVAFGDMDLLETTIDVETQVDLSTFPFDSAVGEDGAMVTRGHRVRRHIGAAIVFREQGACRGNRCTNRRRGDKDETHVTAFENRMHRPGRQCIPFVTP